MGSIIRHRHKRSQRSSSRQGRRGRTYSLSHLLKKQPKGVSKQQGYAGMLAHLHADSRLQTVRISSRCYTLLNTARITPENLHTFYRTYRLPKNPFFPLFLACKRAYLQEREQLAQARRRYILDRVRSLPEQRLTAIRYLGFLERSVNYAGKSPVWQKHLFPSSKKTADAYARLSFAEWHALLSGHLQNLCARYSRLNRKNVMQIEALCLLELLPDARSATTVQARTLPTATAVKRSYRTLSLQHHPDRGGEPQVFMALKSARDTLIGD